MKRTNSCTTKKSFAEISIFLASKWFFISIFVVTILCYMTPVYYGDGVSEMSTLELLRLKANPSFAIEPMQYQISVILPRAVQGYLAMFVPVLSALPFIVFQQAEKSGRYQRFYMFRSTSSRQYYGKKWLFGMVTGGLVLLFGVILFELSFIAMDYYISGTITVGKSVEQLFYMQYYAGIFVYGAVSAIPAMLISFLCCNLYFIVCIPFIAVFMYNLLVFLFVPLCRQLSHSTFRTNSREFIQFWILLYIQRCIIVCTAYNRNDRAIDGLRRIRSIAQSP